MTDPRAPHRHRWITGMPLPGEPSTRLYCFPHSGGLAGEYVRWGRVLPGVHVHAISLPGRAGSSSEPAILDMAQLVSALLDGADFAPPFAFFGHSLGALVAFEAARSLRARGRPGPERLIVSAYAAPHLPRIEADIRDLPDPELLAAITERYGAFPPEVASDPELLELFLPPIRADFTLLETYRHQEGEPLAVPIDVFGGDRDTIPFGRLEQWSRHTTGPCRVRRFQGGHFYFRDDPPALHASLRAILQPRPSG